MVKKQNKWLINTKVKRQNKWLTNPKFKCCSQCDQVSEVKVNSVHVSFNFLMESITVHKKKLDLALP